MKKFFTGLIVMILILSIGYAGYTFMLSSNTGHNTGNTANSSQDQTSNSMNNQTLLQANFALQNKENLDQAITLLESAMKVITLDLYAPGNQGIAEQNNNIQSVDGTNNRTQSNTTINIYPSFVQPGSTNAPAQIPTYDPAKMEQLHTGFYKISVGMQFINQLRVDFISQAEQAGVDIKDPVQFYSNQYVLTLQNKNKLNQVIWYINEAANLININPYVSANGAAYDKEKMQQVHDSVLKLAQSTVMLNKLSDDMTKQAVTITGQAKNYTDSTQMNMGPTNNMSGIFGNINFGSIANILLIIFISAFIIGILGFIFGLLKPSSVQVKRAE